MKFAVNANGPFSFLGEFWQYVDVDLGVIVPQVVGSQVAAVG